MLWILHGLILCKIFSLALGTEILAVDELFWGNSRCLVVGTD